MPPSKYSFSGRKIWKTSIPHSEVCNLLSKELGISKIVAGLLVNRNITSSEEAKLFLYPSLSHLNNPFLMSGMSLAVNRIKTAISKNEKITVYGDFDVDGITSTALVVSVLKKLEADVNFYIPSRFEEGYGLNKSALKKLEEAGSSLVITVDCGITAIEEVDYASKIGLDIIITDHHLPGENIPKALSVIDPKQDVRVPDTGLPACRQARRYPYSELAGVGVAFKLVQALCEDLNADIKFDDNPEDYQLLTDNLDLVALGTVADMVPLSGENRVIVKNGLKILNATKKPGLIALKEVSGLNDKEITAGQVGYWLAPRLNAGGRMTNAGKCVELLLTEDIEFAKKTAKYLDEKNKERQSIEEKILNQALEMVEKEVDLDKEKVIVLASENWHEGVKGIVASRLVNKYFRPTILFSIKGDKANGSGRSISGFHLFDALTKCDEFLERYGGHACAAGLSLSAKHLGSFREKINQIASETLDESDLIPKLSIDLDLHISQVDKTLLKEIELLSPFGIGNPTPVLSLKNTLLSNLNYVGDGKHLKFSVIGNGTSISGIGFNYLKDYPKDSFEKDYQPVNVDLAFTLDKNKWNGREELQLKLVDLKILKEATKLPAIGGRDDFVEKLFADASEIIKDEDYKNIGDADSFYSKVAGVTFEGRQAILANLEAGTRLDLIREPDNPHDENAIRVDDENGNNLGYIKSAMAKHLALVMDSGCEYEGKVTEVTGKEADKHLGVNILVRKKKIDGAIEQGAVSLVPEELKNLDKPKLVNELAKRFLNGNKLREKQKEALGNLLQGKNCLAIMGTGRGKSAIFHIFSAIEAIKDNKISVILYPLRSLINDQHCYLKQVFSEIGLNVVFLSGDVDFDERESIFAALALGEAHVVLTTPEFIYHNKFEFDKLKKRIGFLVVDESHHVSTSSQLHRPLYGRLNEVITSMGNPLVLAITATAGETVAPTIYKTLGIEKVVIDPNVRKNLRLIDKRGIRKKDFYIKDVIAQQEKSIIYVNSREQSVKIASALRESVPHLRNKIVYYNAGMDSSLRCEVEEGFRNGDFLTVVSTSAFGEGVNIPDIRNIFLYHMPFSFITYNQQSGRAGRDDEESNIHVLFGEKDAKINRLILESMAPSRKELVNLYRALKNISKGSPEGFELTNKDILSEVEIFGRTFLNEKGVSAGLKIFRELGLVEVSGNGLSRRIKLCGSKEKLSLSDSIRHEEGQDEKALFSEFKKWVLESSEEDLLSMINQPIYPKDWLEG
ncbi:single-stranded-DNA-specific exonuclease RecJ [Candidatus Oleimmundimicrobium sp.]|uniref:single-stranded-DNA-specific exonuclease RecJ n=1 Tax=Candidatus Oleimmundimicrobium sp. TaxID=3060597 RepID=UPI00271ABD5B|nr:single-stranded-DNA-specific exonuclease RecJ [Candidatus Oleimmundimicrobium sp.]MDO8886721.1 single-stranded-DNA-specific exonuclease RecJ [Candidatus Oleimmundimicrobium sp.]